MSQEPSKRSRSTRSVLLRLATIALLVLGLLIPISMIGAVNSERSKRQSEVTDEVAERWGGRQLVGGPVLVLPLGTPATGHTELESSRHLYVLPSRLRIEATLAPETRNLGIFETTVYRATLHCSGLFDGALLGRLRQQEELRWDLARIGIGVSDTRSLETGDGLLWNGTPRLFRPGDRLVDLFHAGINAPLGELAAPGDGEDVPFEFDLSLSGSGKLMLLPLGEETVARMTSRWPNPGFVGSFSPVRRSLSAEGFEADWEISYLGRGLPSVWESTGPDSDALATLLLGSAFGTELVQPVTAYRLSERALKYAVLFLVVTFTAFFLFEVLSDGSPLPFHYLLVGFAMCLFYLLLLSLAEHLGFRPAYLLAALATVLLIALYSASFLGGARAGSLIGVILSALYGYLYALLQLEDYALLIGSVGLFALLALTMFATRRLGTANLRPAA